MLHAGNMGLKQGLEQVVDAAAAARDRARPPSASSWPAAGTRRAEQPAGRRPSDARLPGRPVPEVRAGRLLAAADVLLLSERATQLDMSLPSKLTSYLAAGRPIVAAVPPAGASARRDQRSGAGSSSRPATRPRRPARRCPPARRPAGERALRPAGPAFAAPSSGGGRACGAVVRFVDGLLSLRHRGADIGTRAPSSPGSPARTAPTWPSSSSTRATRSTASSAAPARSTRQRIDHLYRDPHEAETPALPPLRRPDRQLEPHRPPPPDQARRGLQPGRPEPRQGELRDARVHRRDRRRWARSGCWRPSARRTGPSASTRPAAPRCTARCSRRPSARRRPSTRAARTPSPRSSPTS